VAAVGTADALQSVLADLDRQRRQLHHLVPRGRTSRLALMLAEDVAAAAALRPVVDDVRDPFDREQRVRSQDGQAARLACGPSPVTGRFPSHGRSWLGGNDELRESRFSRCSSSSTPLRQRRQLRALRLQPRRQRKEYLDDRLTPLRVDRLRLRTLHTRSFATPKRVPAD
jgi:hypothetical protein